MKRVFSILFLICVLAIVPAALADELFKSGSYEGTGSGNNGDIVVRVTVDANSITDIEVINHVETEGISDIAFERIPKSIIENQSLAVDTVSTATNSSKGILEAVKNALEGACSDIDSLLIPKVQENTKEGQIIEKSADVIVVGGGGAGVAAASSALESGASVILIEKTPALGGNTAISGGGYNTADSERQKNSEFPASALKKVEELLSKEPHDEFEKELQKTVSAELKEHLSGENAQTLFDSPAFHMLQTYNGGDYKGKPELIRTLCSGSLDALHWLESKGLKFKDDVHTITGGLYQRGHKSTEPLGVGYINVLSEDILKSGGEIIFEARANELIMEAEKVVGVKAVCSNGDKLILHANKGVVMATGGFAANVELRQKVNTLWPELGENIPTTNTSAITGDGIDMAKKAGANIINMEDIQLLPLGDPKNGSLKGKIGRIPSDFIFVNREGKRFVAEDARRDVMSKALLEQTDSYMFIIDDGDSYPTLDSRTNFNVTIGEMIDQGTVFCADTIEELAKKIAVDPETLRQTVDIYNTCVDEQKDEVYGKTTFTNKIDKAPFYACPRVPTVHHTMGGIEINAEAQVLNTQGKVIPGLFAAGEVTGGIHGTNRLGGNAIADAITFGRIAGNSAAK